MKRSSLYLCKSARDSSDMCTSYFIALPEIAQEKLEQMTTSFVCWGREWETVKQGFEEVLSKLY